MTMQDLIDELVDGYVQSKYDEKYLKEKMNEILEFILQNIAAIIKSMKERELAKLWNVIKEDEKIKDLFRKTLEKTDRTIAIYVTSKFENNQYLGTRIIEEALKWK